MPLAPEALGPTIAIGEILAEIMATSRGEGFNEPVPMVGPYPSGAPAIFIDQCGRMGGAAAMIGAVGDDDFGHSVLRRLRRDGVDVSAVHVDAELPTGTAFVRYRDDGARDFVFNMWTSAAGQLAWRDPVERVVSAAGHLHVMGTLLPNATLWPMIARAAAAVKARGGTVSFDPNLRPELRADQDAAERYAQMVAMTDVLLPSDQELLGAAGLGPSADEAQALEQLFASGVKEIVVKRGAKGAECHSAEGAQAHAPAFAVEEVDPTGAGDCFGGAYVTARRLGLSVEQALTYGNAAGARNVTRRGPMEGAGSRAELDAFIANTERLA
ncbi:Fructokinase [Candidatus Rhodobacter oscarellae]|uniref:Fructokinase n=1 Tax=Candidatus Rhodobacter oscarellae TaxID=1675527 RepID=A0A0J9DZQ8_9RHOB|nr:sugar kinase [Candidatus Rhodobacter lobularis]KMW56146.1 Fructokinase [Candidatus Rhodobacter lobularis]